MTAGTNISQQIKELYWERKLSQSKIAQQLGISQSYIALLMKKHKIVTRSRSEAERGVNNPFYGRKHTIETKLNISQMNSHARNSEIAFDEKQMQILDGLLLGDGHINPNRFSGRYTQGCKYEEFLTHVKEILPLKWSPMWYDKKWNCYHMKSLFTPTLKEVRERWYPNGKKIVPRNLVVSNECLLYWFLSDGSIEFSNRRIFPNSKYFRIRLATDGFDSEDNSCLINKLKEVGIEATYRSKKLHIHAKSNERFFNMLGKPPINCYKYKWGFR